MVVLFIEEIIHRYGGNGPFPCQKFQKINRVRWPQSIFSGCLYILLNGQKQESGQIDIKLQNWTAGSRLKIKILRAIQDTGL